MKNVYYLILSLIAFTISASAQWSIDSIAAPYYGLASTQNGSKAIFASGSNYQTYDFTTNTWSVHNMVQPRPNVKAATANGKSYFAGGGYIYVSSYNFFKNVDIYNSSNNTWSTTNLSVARMVGASAAVGNKVLFAGGRQILNYSNRVDIFDVTTGLRTTYNLSQARHNMAVAVVGTKVIFAGGETGNISNGVYTESNKVDIYDDATGIWTSTTLSVKREQITAAVVGNKVLFAGGLGVNGIYSNRIDIYDASNNTWSFINMSETKYGIAAATAGNKVYLAGGTTSNSGALTNRVEIYNSTNNTISYVTISSPRMSMSVGQTPNRIMFAGGVVTWGNVGTDRVEVLDLVSNTWSVEYLSRPRLGLASASFGNKAMFAGGAEVLSSYPQYSIISNRVDIWTDPALKYHSTDNAGADQQTLKNISVYPNPAAGNTINIDLSKWNTENIEVNIFNPNGQMVLGTHTQGYSPSLLSIDVSMLSTGIYYLNVRGNLGSSTIPFYLQR